MSSDATPVSSPQTAACDQSGNSASLSGHLGRYQAGIAEVYFEINEPESSRPSQSRRLRVAAFGLGGVLAGAGISYAFPAMPGYEIGLVAIAGGWLAGRLAEPVAGGWRTRLSERDS
jgi:hypothetical protein